MSWEIWEVTRFSLLAATAATAIMLPPGVLIAWALARRTFVAKDFVETFVSLPLVLPPVATGLILLTLFGRRGPLGRWMDSVGVEVIFTRKAVVLAMAVMGLPLLVRTVQTGFEHVNIRYEQVAATLGASPVKVFLTISLPLASRSVIAGALLGFSRALGEFGATIMIAGNIPGRTRTLALAIYGYTETGQDRNAFILLLVSVAIAFSAVWVSNRLVHGRFAG